MLKWWRVPLYPDWINAENTIIWLVTFQMQISNSNFQIFKFKTNFWFFGFRFLLQNVFLKLINNFVFFVFILVDAFSGSIKTEKTQEIFLPWQKIISAKENFRALAWTLAKFYLRERNGQSRRAVSLHLARSGSQSERRIRRILPARWACHKISIINDVAKCNLAKFKSSCANAASGPPLKLA